LQAWIKRKKRKTTDSKYNFPRYPNLVQNLEIARLDQVWVSDITYIRLCIQFVYLAVIMDVFTRGIRGRHVGRGLDQTLTLLALHRALVHHQAPGIHHSDQRAQYASTTYTQILRDANVQISMAEVGEAWRNGYAERLVRTIKEEEVDLSEYRDYTGALCQLSRFLGEVHKHKRIHSALGHLTPAEFKAQWQRELVLVQNIPTCAVTARAYRLLAIVVSCPAKRAGGEEWLTTTKSRCKLTLSNALIL